MMRSADSVRSLTTGRSPEHGRTSRKCGGRYAFRSRGLAGHDLCRGCELRDSGHFLSHITPNGRIIMLDILGAITGTAIYAVVVGTLIGFAPVRRATRLALLAAAIAWAVLISAVAALGGLAPGTMGPVPATLLPFASVLVALLGSWFVFPRFPPPGLSDAPGGPYRPECGAPRGVLRPPPRRGR